MFSCYSPPGFTQMEISNYVRFFNFLPRHSRTDWEHRGHLHSSNFPIAPVESVVLTLPIPHAALCPQTSGGTNIVRLCPLPLRLVDAFLPDFRDRCALLAFQPRPNHFFPGITFVTRLLLWLTAPANTYWRSDSTKRMP
jgi:hypothetical protein